jgi:hypothetical protein|tara:strand:- start:2494 stop:2922 length:429 start_codon:yes stop_codon:yes gene_type:complete
MMASRSSLRSRVKAEAHDVDGLVQLFFEAAETERRMPRAVDHRVKGCWPEYPDDPNLAFGYNDAVVSVGPANAKEVTRYDLALEAAILLDADERALVWAAAHSAARRRRGARWKAIARRMGVHPSTAKRRFERAMLGLWYRL